MPYSFLLVVVAVAVEHDTVDMDCCDPARPDDRVISIAIEICVFFLNFLFLVHESLRFGMELSCSLIGIRFSFLFFWYFFVVLAVIVTVYCFHTCMHLKRCCVRSGKDVLRFQLKICTAHRHCAE